MPGRPQGLARKVGELERAILAVYQQIDATIPPIHKQTRRDGSSASESPWVNLHRANGGLALAVADVGEHCRKAAGIDGPGPIEAELGGKALHRLRETRSDHAKGDGRAEPADHAAIEAVAGLPLRAAIIDEIDWVAGHVGQPIVDIGTAPSRFAVNLLNDLRADERLRRDFWTLVLNRRLAPGEHRHSGGAYDEQERTQSAGDVFERLGL